MNPNCVRRTFASTASHFTVKRAKVRSPARGVHAAATAGLREIRRSLLPLGVAILCAVPAARAQDAADNVVIVLDASGSMAGKLPGSSVDKMTAAKSALKEVLKSVPPETHIGLLVFSAKDAGTDWFYPLGPRDDAKLMQAIDRPMPGGNTPLGTYIKKGADRLLEERTKQFGYGTFRLLVVTDGEATDGQLTERYTPEVIARGITVDAIGVAMKERHTLATRVHSYRSANDPAALKRAIAEVFGEIGGRGQDVGGEEAFAELKPIPNEIAQGMIQALAASGNQPIGERPKPSPERVAPAAGPAAAVASPQPTPAVAGRTGGKAGTWIGLFGGLSCFGLFALALLILVIRAIKKSQR